MKCLDSLRPQGTEWQLVLVANGKPLAPTILEFARLLTPHFTLIENDRIERPGRARNIALGAVTGEWIFFVDDDAFVLSGYWDKILPLLQDPRIDVLGGPDSPARGMNSFSLSLALALSSPFCTGATFFRHKSFGKKLQHADEEKLTSCNLWVRKSALHEVTFPEDYVRAEENLFLQRLARRGAAMYYHPGLVVAHFRRTKISQLWRPTFYAGYSRSRLMKEKLKSGTEVFWLPAFFVLLHLLILIDQVTFWYLVRLYAGIIIMVSMGLSMRIRRFWLFPLVAFFHYYVVFIYGVGFLAERIGVKR